MHKQLLTMFAAAVCVAGPLKAQSAPQLPVPANEPAAVAAPAQPTPATAAPTVATPTAAAPAVAAPVTTAPTAPSPFEGTPATRLGVAKQIGAAEAMSAPMMLPRARTTKSTALMLVGAAGIVVGALIGGSGGNILMLGSGVVGLYGLYLYLQ